MSRRWIVLIGAVVLAGVIGFLVWQQITNAQAARPLFTAADLAVAQKGTLIATVSATGAIEPQTSTTLAFLTNGNITKILVKRGDTVTAGQVLAQLDATELEFQLQQAQ